MTTPQQDLLSIIVATEGGRPGRAYPFKISGTRIVDFPGIVQATFLSMGYQVSDLASALTSAVASGWLSPGNKIFGAGALSDGNFCQSYILEMAGFTEAGGVAPIMQASAQQLIRVAAAINNQPNGARFNIADLRSAFVGTVGANTFAPEDLMPAYGYAVAQGWIRPADTQFEPVFVLTAAGAAAAT